MVTPSSLTKSRISRRTTTTLRKHAVSVEPKSVEAFFPSQKALQEVTHVEDSSSLVPGKRCNPCSDLS